MGGSAPPVAPSATSWVGGGPGGVPSPNGRPPSSSRWCGTSQPDRSGPAGTIFDGFRPAHASPTLSRPLAADHLHTSLKIGLAKLVRLA